MAPEQPFIGIQAVGSEGSGRPYANLRDMAANYVKVIRTVQPQGPYYVGGFSLGGSVALEMAQQFHAAGAKVGLLAILDHTPPPTRFSKVVWHPRLPLDFLVNAFRWVREDIWRAGRGKRLAALRHKVAAGLMRIHNGLVGSHSTAGQADAAVAVGGRHLPDDFRSLMATHYQALRDYVPQPYAGRVTLFRAQTRPLFRLHGRDLGWTSLAQGGLDIVIVPGNHETMLTEPNVHVLARTLLHHLERAQAEADTKHGRSGSPSAAGAPPGRR